MTSHSHPPGVEEIWSADIDGGDGLIAVIVRHTFSAEGVTFFTDSSLPLQLAGIAHPKGHVVPAHVHLPRTRKIETTGEVLIVRRGCISLTLYAGSGREVATRELVAGDVVLLQSGGHRVEVVRDGTELYEIKQGPYFGKDLDKREL